MKSFKQVFAVTALVLTLGIPAFAEDDDAVWVATKGPGSAVMTSTAEAKTPHAIQPEPGETILRTLMLSYLAVLL